METFEAISKRASLKARLSPRAIEPEKIKKILNAASLAPSAGNRQPWRFIVVTDKEVIETLASKVFSEQNVVVKEAPVIIFACANPSDDVVVGGREYYVFDVALAVENMLLAATDLGLVTHLMTSLNEDEMKKMLHVPEEVRFVVATPLAYPTGDSYEEAAKERLSQRTRKDLGEVVYWEAWGKSA